MEPPKGVVEKTVRKGFEPKSLVQIIFSGQFEWTSWNRYEIISLADVLRIKLRETLREDMGGIYGVGVRPSFSRYPDEEYYFAISFGCAPEKVEEIQRRRWETGLRKNGFWLNALQTHYLHGEDPGNILKYGELVGKLTPDAVRRAARTYLDTGNYVKVVLYPEG
ncbi:MAG TPA: insulinase family protein [Candidatus Latescibacteria bacterium]|nr:insulinase family protein [Candidatus Latescibacterota bacterium]